MSLRLRYLCTTLVLVALGLGYALIQGRPARPGPLLPPGTAAAARPAQPPPAPPTARQILDRKVTLSLTAEQAGTLTALDRTWQEESAPLEAALREAEGEFSRFLKETQANGRTSLQEIQRRSADVRELSAALRDRRLRHAEASTNVLNEIQRRKLAPSPISGTVGGER